MSKQIEIPMDKTEVETLLTVLMELHGITRTQSISEWIGDDETVSEEQNNQREEALQWLRVKLAAATDELND